MSRRKMRVSFNSPVILTFTAVSFAALLLGYVTKGASTDAFFSVYRSSLLSPLTYVRLVGHVFGHAGWDHFIGNIMLLLVVGPLLEEKYGPKSMLVVILVTAVVTGAVNCIFFPGRQLLGASGVVFALILLASFTGSQSGRIPVTFILVAAIYLGQQVYEGIFLEDDVSNLTHIFGGVIGAVLGYVMNKKRMNRY